jgi:uncharacterized protein (DUF1330 family)
MAERLILVVSLQVHEGREAEFERFEAEAARIMRRYGGRIDRRIRCLPTENDPQPFELHLVSFPDALSFERYRADPELAGLAALRATAIRQTTLWSGVDCPLFGT